MKPFAEKFYKSTAWKKTRHEYLKYVFEICEICGKKAYIVHHKIPLTPENIEDPYITLGFSNLQAVCLECHNTIHGQEKILNNNLFFNTSGELCEGHPPGKNFRKG